MRLGLELGLGSGSGSGLGLGLEGLEEHFERWAVGAAGTAGGGAARAAHLV